MSENLLKSHGGEGNNHLDVQKRIFNDRLSRGRRVVENVFSILVSRFGIFQRQILLSPDKATTITLACCYLHNCQTFARNATGTAKFTRETLQCYFLQERVRSVAVWTSPGKWRCILKLKQRQALKPRWENIGKTSCDSPPVSNTIVFLNCKGVSWSLRNSNESKHQNVDSYTSSAAPPDVSESFIFLNYFQKLVLNELIFFLTASFVASFLFLLL